MIYLRLMFTGFVLALFGLIGIIVGLVSSPPSVPFLIAGFLLLMFGGALALVTYYREEARDRKSNEEQRRHDDLMFKALRGEETRCDTCGELLFAAIPHKTTEEEIKAFAAKSKLSPKHSQALDGWIHPGVYCPNGCFNCLVEFDIPEKEATPEEIDQWHEQGS